MHIGRYIIKRIIWLIPTLLLLIWLVGLLEEKMPGDPVQNALRTADYEFDESPMARRARYNTLSRRLGINSASFYLSIKPANLSNGINLQDVRFEEAKVSWLRKYDVEKVNRYFGMLVDHMQDIPDTLPQNEQATLFAEYCRIGEAEPSQDWGNLSLRRIGHEKSKALHGAREEALDSRISILNSLPVIQWHGTNNKFHKRVSNFLTGNWGRSVKDGRPVSQKIIESLQWTLLISMVSLVLSLIIALWLGWWASLHDQMWREKALSQLLFAVFATPLFWLATLLIVFFTTEEYGEWTNIFPGVGIINTGASGILSSMIKNWTMLILPILCLSLGSIAYFYQFVLTGQREERRKTYFWSALSKGLSQRQALTRHTLINTIFPLIGLLAVILPGLISGALIIEVLFNIPGMGRLMYNAILGSDWNVVTAIVFLSGIVAFAAMMLIDIVMHSINPKFKFDE